MQPNAYKDGKAIVKRLRELHAEGKLDELTEKLLFAPKRPPEELYEWTVDRYQVRNLAGDPKYADTLAESRARLDSWVTQTGDRGQQPESEAMYNSDMAVYLGEKKGTHRAELEANIAQMRRWAAEGK